MSAFRTHYDNLQVKETASDEVIRGAYRHLAQKWHPDKNLNQKEEAERNTKLINDSYAVLSDPQSRKEHDEWIAWKRSETDSSANSENAKDMKGESPATTENPKEPSSKLISFLRWVAFFPVGILAGFIYGGLILGIGNALVGHWVVPSAVVMFMGGGGIVSGTLITGFRIAPKPINAVKWIMLSPSALYVVSCAFILLAGIEVPATKSGPFLSLSSNPQMWSFLIGSVFTIGMFALKSPIDLTEGNY